MHCEVLGGSCVTGFTVQLKSPPRNRFFRTTFRQNIFLEQEKQSEPRVGAYTLMKTSFTFPNSVISFSNRPGTTSCKERETGRKSLEK